MVESFSRRLTYAPANAKRWRRMHILLIAAALVSALAIAWVVIPLTDRAISVQQERREQRYHSWEVAKTVGELNQLAGLCKEVLPNKAPLLGTGLWQFRQQGDELSVQAVETPESKIVLGDLAATPIDAWGNPYFLRMVKNDVAQVYSLGPNRRDDDGMGDDIMREITVTETTRGSS